MKFNKPKFWDREISIYAIILYPFTILVHLVIFIKKKISRYSASKLPIVCIGNIYIGGTGKTPLTIFIANKLKNLGKRPVIVRKFYKEHNDEYGLIKDKFEDFILNTSRIKSIREAENSKYDCVILDDGFQDLSIHKNFNIICFNGDQLIGNGMVLPSGPLRDNLNSLKSAHVIIINGERDVNFENKILKINSDLEFFYSRYKPTNAEEFIDKKLLAIAGIGNPDNFFKLLIKNNLNIEKKIVYPDHYVFTKNEILNIVNEANSKNYQIIMTEKDYYKIKDFNISEIKYLKINLEINQSEKFIKKILKIYDQKY